jgi:hypothetical protein
MRQGIALSLRPNHSFLNKNTNQMKTSYFLIFLAIYGFITGSMLLFNPSGSLENFGMTSSDKYHIVIIQYLGVFDIGLSIILLLFRNSSDRLSIRNILIGLAFILIGNVLKGLYDVYLVHIPANTYFWVDYAFTLLVGFACLYFAFKKNEK